MKKPSIFSDVIAFISFATSVSMADVAVVSGAVEQGVWNGNFAETREYAEKHHTPLFYMWSRPSSSCGNCAKAHRAVNRPSFVSWMEERQYVFAFEEGGSAGTPPAYAYAGGIRDDSMPYFPCIRVYWPKKDGTAVDVNFSGVAGYIPGTVADQDLKNDTLAKALINAVDKLVGTYEPRKVAEVSFDVEDGQMLEILSNGRAIIGINRVDSGSATNYLVIAGVTNDIVWAENEDRKEFFYDLPDGHSMGDELDLELLDGEYPEIGAVATAKLRVVAQLENSVANPYWIGERTTANLNWGEWTMDLDAATGKVAAAEGEAYTLALVSGTLWCPWCIGLENGVLSTEAFGEWARENHVTLVNIDNPKRSASDLKDAAGNLISVGDKNDGAAPSLLKYELGANGKSGAGYLSRKCIEKAQAYAVLQRNHDLGYKIWVAPESLRTGYPSLLLLNKQGKLAARFAYCADTNKTFDTAENIARLNDLLKLADRGDERDSHASTTSLFMVAGGDSKTTSLQINERTKIFKVLDIPASATVTFSASAQAGKSVTLKICATDSTIAAGKILATGTGTVSYRFSDSAENIYLSVSTYDDTSRKTGGSTTFETTIASRVVLHHGSVSFVDGSQRVWDRSENPSLKIQRVGGFAGKASVVVRLSNAGSLSSGRLDWEDVTLVWADGEYGVREIPLSIALDRAYPTEESATFSLENAKDSTAVLGTLTNHLLTVYSIDAPTVIAQDVNLYTTFATEQSFPVQCVENPKTAKLKIISGKLPSGMKLAYDKKTGCVILSGTPTRTATATISFTLSERRGKETKTGPETTITIKVTAPSTVNPCVDRAVSGLLPLMAANTVAGTLDVSVTAKNKIKATYQGTGKKKLVFSDVWQDLLDDGTAISTLTMRSGEILTLKLSTDGRVNATLSGVSNVFASQLTARELQLIGGADYARYSGYYTVSLPMSAESIVATPHATGPASMILKLNASTFTRKGKFSFTGMLPNGQTINGASMLMVDAAGQALLPIFWRGNKDCLGVLLKLNPDAATGYIENPMAITMPDDVVGHWTHAENGYSFQQEASAYGAYYDASVNLEVYCASVYDTSEMAATVNSTDFIGGARFGVPQVMEEIGVSVVGNKLSFDEKKWLKLSFNRKTGVVSGKVKIVFQNGSAVTAPYWGVLLPGWHDCGCRQDTVVERPFASAAIYWSDKLNGKSVKLGVGLEVLPKYDGEE